MHFSPPVKLAGYFVLQPGGLNKYPKTLAMDFEYLKFLQRSGNSENQTLIGFLLLKFVVNP
jgi:hypothetical protein